MKRDDCIATIKGKKVALYKGLLALAHEKGLERLTTELLQFPSDDNGQMCIFRCQVTIDGQSYTGHGDASPKNVGGMIAPHFIRMAETRAKGRALRDALNIGTVCLDELADLGEAPQEGYEPPHGTTAPQEGYEPPHGTTAPQQGDLPTKAPTTLQKAKTALMKWALDKHEAAGGTNGAAWLQGVASDVLGGKVAKTMRDVQQIREAITNGEFDLVSGEYLVGKE